VPCLFAKWFRRNCGTDDAAYDVTAPTQKVDSLAVLAVAATLALVYRHVLLSYRRRKSGDAFLAKGRQRVHASLPRRAVGSCSHCNVDRSIRNREVGGCTVAPSDERRPKELRVSGNPSPFRAAAAASTNVRNCPVSAARSWRTNSRIPNGIVNARKWEAF
jgi:hypothetical protein